MPILRGTGNLWWELDEAMTRRPPNRVIMVVLGFWIGLPILLGWFDAARLMLLDDAQFHSRSKVGSSAVETRRGESLQKAG